MNWKVWAAFVVIVGGTLALGTSAFLSSQGGQIVEPTSEHVTDIYVDLDQAYEGMVTVTYPEEGASDDDFDVVVAARRDVHVLLQQYFIPYEDPDDVRVRRRRGEVSMSFPIFARERLDFIFPEVTLVGSWLPLWETLHVTILLPEGYEVTETTDEGLRDGLEADERGGRWELTGEAYPGGRADFAMRFSRVHGARETP